MEPLVNLRPRGWHLLEVAIASLLVLAVACGTTAPPEPVVVEREVTKEVPKEVVVEKEVERIVVATPTPAPDSAATTVHPGKVSLMVGRWGAGGFDSAIPTGSDGAIYQRIVHGFLVSDNEKKEMVPGIARQWDLSDDALTWSFTIREGVKWHNGAELTIEDVVWTLEHTMGQGAVEYATASPGRIARDMDRIEITGPDVVSVTTNSPQLDLPLILSTAGAVTHPMLPGRAEVRNEEEERAYDRNPVGAGVMKLVTHTPQYVMRFERFDDYYYHPDNGLPEDQRVNFQSLDLFLVPEEATRIAALRSGEADIAPVSLSTIGQVTAGGGRVTFVNEAFTIDARIIGCHEGPHLPCYDKRVRQALEYAIDKEVIRDDLYGGPEVFHTRGWWSITPSTIGYTPALDPRPFDPEKARQLLADAGYPGGEGFGKLIVNTYPSTGLPFVVESAQLAADFWRRELGLDVEVRVGDSVSVTAGERSGELNGQIVWRENEARVDATTTIISRYGDPGNSRKSHNDPELFQAVTDVVEIIDERERVEALKTLIPRLRDESYALAIGYANAPWGVGPRIATWQPYPLGGFSLALHTITLK